MLIPIDAADTGVLTVPQAKAQLGVEHDQHDDLIEDYIAAAQDLVAQQAEVVLSPTTLEQRLDCWPVCGPVEIAAGPVREVEAIAYLDADGEEVALEATDWRWEPTATGADVWFLSAFARPTLQAERRGAVRILFAAGYSDPAASPGDPRLKLPAYLRQAVRMLVAHWYANREPVAIGQTVFSIPLSVQDCIDAGRVYRP